MPNPKCIRCHKEIDLDNAHKSRYHVHPRCALKKCCMCLKDIKAGYFIARGTIVCRPCYDAHEKRLEQRTGESST